VAARGVALRQGVVGTRAGGQADANRLAVGDAGIGRVLGLGTFFCSLICVLAIRHLSLGVRERRERWPMARTDPP
jgi:hypothetical protein